MSENTNQAPLLEVKHLRKLFPAKSGFLAKEKTYIKAVDDVSFTLMPRETLGVVGESGCGKSTMGRSVLRLIEPTDGEILYKGEDFRKANGQQLRGMRADMQIIFQDPYASLNPRMTVGEVIAEPLNIQKRCNSKEEVREQVLKVMEVVGLNPKYYNRYPHEFSGGQRQRIGIVRALSVNPRLLFCDESVSALDVSVQAQILNLFNELKQQFHLTYVFIGHDLAVIRYISDQILVMYLGKIMEIAPYDQLFGENTHPYTQALVSAVPEPSTAGRSQRILLEGDIPSPVNPPTGCRFCNRCFQAQEICKKEEPEMVKTGDRHWIRCHFVKPANESLAVES